MVQKRKYWNCRFDDYSVLLCNVQFFFKYSCFIIINALCHQNILMKIVFRNWGYKQFKLINQNQKAEKKVRVNQQISGGINCVGHHCNGNQSIILIFINVNRAFWICGCKYYLGDLHIYFDALITSCFITMFVEFQFYFIRKNMVSKIYGKGKSQAKNIWCNLPCW